MLPAAVQRQVDRAAALVADRSKGNGEHPAPANTAQPAGANEKVQADLKVAEAEVQRLTAAYRALQGKYDSEVPRMAEDIRGFKAKITDLEGQIERAGIKPGQVNSLSEGERETAGPIVDIATKIAREISGEAVEAAAKPLREELQLLQRQNEDAFMATLNEGLPAGWDSDTGVNNDPKFMAWLQLLDPATQLTRFSLLKRAEGAKQGHKVVEIFRAYAENREIGARAESKSKAKQRIDPPPGGADAHVDLSEDGGKKTWTVGEIQEFYRTKRTDPQYQGLEGAKKARAIEVDIAAAQREGRVKG